VADDSSNPSHTSITDIFAVVQLHRYNCVLLLYDSKIMAGHVTHMGEITKNFTDNTICAWPAIQRYQQGMQHMWGENT
jgi:hypothetical protein